MRCLTRRLPILSAFLLVPLSTWAQEAPTTQEFRELKQTVLQQSKQIELLAEQIGRLTRAVEGQRPPESPVPPPSAEVPKPAAEPAPEAPKAEAVPKAEPVAGGAKHTVAKGETLTSIAKQYNITITDLKNANKIENDRKLQIGQILTVPTAKTPETADKKENP